ncbi:hypothetical protein AtubIFM56815_007774 [Aspergillus tubingensis]|uniref:Heterokaryon incompatibility domain-containing protein n=1 Tax=Aspergillus tubingensis TaxID=5068 RepID=A0A9W6AN83_ASPTU|nr:hypothetical protein AtubIFM54640_006472 [Aspergillus tubingensis]GLA83569.1 hypothetical protein AtubIFM56815_007774 [Aspergillus tubingensis]
MSPEPERNSGLTGPTFTYTEVPLESPNSTTRMIRLLPNKNKDAEIECELFNYDLTSGGGADSHLYEALSYVWGSNTRSRTIKLNSCAFPVTENLYLALSRLRNRQLERILWVDAICIDQSNRDEKAKQIPLMREIYAQAQHVIVWLGEAYEDGDKALDGLRCLAEGQDIDIEGCRKLCVLQEVGVARSIYIMCGSVKINGHALGEGLKKIGLPSKYQEKIGPVAFLIKGALLRPNYEPGSRGTLTIGELVGMYCYHDATEQHDKIYALLGLSADTMTPALMPNYALPWNTVFNQVTNHMFPGCSVETWPGSDIAIIRGVGWVLGHIWSVRHVSNFGQQKVKVYLNDTARSIGYENDWEADWELQTFAQSLSPGDIVFLLQGALRPSIIRLCKDHFRIITPAATLCKKRPRKSPEGTPQGWHTSGGSCNVLLVWRHPLKNDAGSKNWPETELPDMVPAYQQQSLEAGYRRNNITQIMAGVAMGALAVKKSEDDDVARLLVLSGTDVSIVSELTEASVKDIRGSPDKTLQNFFLSEQDDLSISREMVKAVAENDGPCGYIIMELLFQLHGANLPISEGVVEAASRNSGKYGHQIMMAIYRHRGKFFPISEAVVKAAAGNTGKQGTKILKVLFRAQGEALPVSEEAIKVATGNKTCGLETFEHTIKHRGKNVLLSEDVYKTAIANRAWGYENIKFLSDYLEGKVPISEELVRAAAGNHLAYNILEILLQHGEGSPPITEDVVKAAAENHSGYKFLKRLFQHGEKGPPISEEVVKAAAGNTHGAQILKLLLQHAEESLRISEDVAKAAAGNRISGRIMLDMLFRREGDRLPVTEEVVKAAAGTWGADGLMRLLFKRRGESLPTSDYVVKAAAGNGIYGHRAMVFLFQQKGDKLPVTEEVVKAAAGNETTGASIMKLLFEQKGEGLPMTEEVAKTAARNKYSGSDVLECLLQHKGRSGLPVTEEVVKIAVGNDRCGDRMMESLVQHKGDSCLPVTEEVLRAAAENTRCGARILEILEQERSLQTTVTESAESAESPESPESAEKAESVEGSDSLESVEDA